MARPKKDKNLRHTRHIMLRLTNTEYEIIAENAKAAEDAFSTTVSFIITSQYNKLIKLAGSPDKACLQFGDTHL